MEIIVIKDPIKQEELKRIAKEQFGDFTKAVVDVNQEVMAIGGELHADGEALLIEQEGSKNEYLWGINLYPENTGDDLIEFNSAINLKPSADNRSRGVDNPEVKRKIRDIVERLIL